MYWRDGVHSGRRALRRVLFLWLLLRLLTTYAHPNSHTYPYAHSYPNTYANSDAYSHTYAYAHSGVS